MIKRTIFEAIERHLNSPEITLLVGPRQAGKTYLMKKLEEKLRETGRKTIFLNLDLDETKEFFITQNELLRKIRLQIGKVRGFVFIDEIQRKENAGLFLKGLFDMNLPYKFIVSGSGSLELKEKIHESLSGRKRIFEVNTLSFDEYVNFRTDYSYEERLAEFFSVEKTKGQELLEEYMMFGGYPKVVLAQNVDEKKSVMGEIYQSYLERDIKDLLKLEKAEALTNLVKIIASQIGGVVNITELSSTIGLSHQTTQKYLWYLEKTFILKRVTPYFRNVRKEITKAPMYYFYDLGLRNYILGLFGVTTFDLLGGHLFENFVFHKIRENISFASTSIHFWRTRDNAEVDFIISTGVEVTPVEVKYTKIEKFKITRSFRSFLDKYKPKNGYLVHLGERKTAKIDDISVFLIPFYEPVLLDIYTGQPPDARFSSRRER